MGAFAARLVRLAAGRVGFDDANSVFFQYGEDFVESRPVFSEIGFPEARGGAELDLLFFWLNQELQIIAEAHERGCGYRVEVIFLLFDHFDLQFGERHF